VIEVSVVLKCSLEAASGNILFSQENKAIKKSSKNNILKSTMDMEQIHQSHP